MAKKDSMPAWAIVEMRFESTIIGKKAAPPKRIYVQSHTITYVEPDGRTFSHHLSMDCVPEENTYDSAYLVGFADEPPFAAATISDEGVDGGESES